MRRRRTLHRLLDGRRQLGSQSPASCGVARLLASVLPRLQWLEFEGLGHLGPVTHPEGVNAAIEDYLMRELMA